MAASKEAQTLREEVAGLSDEDTRQMAQPRFPVEPGGFRFCQLADALGVNIPRRNDPGFRQSLPRRLL